jgi:hypothetical protein
LYDLGGPSCDHFDYEDFTWTLAPDGATGVSLTFHSFELEQDYDSLYIYDGPTTASPLIGGYSGTVSPGTVTASGNALTLRYFSDVSTNYLGWMATWNCSVDNIIPQTQINANNWETQDFQTNFSDTDNVGVDLQLYQVLDYDGSEWRANGNFGFFNDNFSTAIHPDWTAAVGIWTINAGHLEQSDASNGNTNIYANLNQSDSLSYLYHWQMKLGGLVANRRAGLHFFCDSAAGVNRGNSYFVYYRADDDKVQIYECTNDVYSLKTNITCVIDTGVWYDCKILYDPSTGIIDAFLNDVIISSWTDVSPLSSGNALSLRTGNCTAMYDDVKVYHSRPSAVTVTVGPSAEVRYQNPDPTTPACRIKSVITDMSGLWSNVAGLDVNIDWTEPLSAAISDGAGADIDTSIITTSYDANWSAFIDPHSGIDTYLAAIGTTPGDSNVWGWTDVSNVLVHSQGGLSLNTGQWYFFSLKARNGAGLISAAFASDGVFIESTIGMIEESGSGVIAVFPNPFVDELNVKLHLVKDANVRLILTGEKGEKVAETVGVYSSGSHNLQLDITNVKPASSSYFLQIYIDGILTQVIRLVH